MAQQSRAFLPKPFYNADSIAEGLGDPNNTTLQAQARRIVDQAIEDDLAHRPSAIGTRQSAIGNRSDSKAPTPDGPARTSSSEPSSSATATHAVFIGTDHHSANITRVRKRVEEGGHDVPQDEIIRWWTAAWANLLDT